MIQKERNFWMQQDPALCRQCQQQLSPCYGLWELREAVLTHEVSATKAGHLPSVALAKSVGKVSLSYGMIRVASLHQSVIHFTGCKHAVLSTSIITELVKKKEVT